ncbi:DUF167 family protein [Candidatus Nanosalina sp. VS9-1]|uniref:DUF167 family protein n=1 Tax=Candidatus Nanosalina sp. VS9-1 TaxID=3388566 RepID=UPI0039DFEF9D
MTEIYVKVRPDSEEISVDTSSAIVQIDLTEPAENGRANSQLLQLIHERTGEEAAIVSGHRSRRKKIKFQIKEESFRQKLQGE